MPHHPRNLITQVLILCAVAVLVVTCARAEDTAAEPAEKLTLIVSATADSPWNQAGFVADLADIERQLAQHLAAAGIDAQASPAKRQVALLQRPLILEVTLAALRVSQRSREVLWSTRSYQALGVDLLATLKDPRGNKELGGVASYYEDSLSAGNDAIVAGAVERLAQDFLAAARQGKLGIDPAFIPAKPEMPSPPPTNWVPAIGIIFGVTALMAFLVAAAMPRKPAPPRTEQEELAWEKVWHDAQLTSVISRRFSEEWYGREARDKTTEILGRAAQTERNEAEYRSREAEMRYKFKQIGAYISQVRGLDHHDVVDVLHNHAAHEYRLLLEARRVAEARRAEEEARGPVRPPSEEERHDARVASADREHEFHKVVADNKFIQNEARRRDQLRDWETRAAAAEYEKKIREAAMPQPPAPIEEDLKKSRLDAARREREEGLELKLQEEEVEVRAGQERVTRAQNQAIKIYQDVTKCAGEKRERIQQILDAYNFEPDILPAALQELMDVDDDLDERYDGEEENA